MQWEVFKKWVQWTSRVRMRSFHILMFNLLYNVCGFSHTDKRDIQCLIKLTRNSPTSDIHGRENFVGALPSTKEPDFKCCWTVQLWEILINFFRCLFGVHGANCLGVKINIVTKKPTSDLVFIHDIRQCLDTNFPKKTHSLQKASFSVLSS